MTDSILAIIPGVGFEVLMLDSGFCGVSGMCLDGSGVALMARCLFDVSGLMAFCVQFSSF